MDRAPTGVTCHAPDLLEHGDAPDRPEATVDDVVDEVVQRVHAIPGTVVLVGHSFGAWVACRALPALGGKVERVVALAGVSGLGAELAARSQGLADALDAGQLTLEAAAAIATDLWLPTVNRSAVDVTAIGQLIASDRPDRLARVLRRQAQLADPMHWIAPFDVPSVSIHNVGDRGAPIALGRQLGALGSGNRFIELDGDGHYPQWSHADVVVEAVFGD